MSPIESVEIAEMDVQMDARVLENQVAVFEPMRQFKSVLPVQPGQTSELECYFDAGSMSNTIKSSDIVLHHLQLDELGACYFDVMKVVAEVHHGTDGIATHVVPFVKDGDSRYVFCREDLKVDGVSLLKVVVHNAHGSISDHCRFTVYGRRGLAPADGANQPSNVDREVASRPLARGYGDHDLVFEQVTSFVSCAPVAPGQLVELIAPVDPVGSPWESEGFFQDLCLFGSDRKTRFELLCLEALVVRELARDPNVAMTISVPFAMPDADYYVFLGKNLEVNRVRSLRVVARNVGTATEHCRCEVGGRRPLTISGAVDRPSNLDEVIEQCDRDEHLEEQHNMDEGRGSEAKPEESTADYLRHVIGGPSTMVGVGPVQVGSGEQSEIIICPRRPFRTRKFAIDATSAPDFDLVDVKVGETSQLAVAGPLDAQLFFGGLPLGTETASIDRPLVVVVVNKSDGPKIFRAALVVEDVESFEEHVEDVSCRYITTVGCGPVWVEGSAPTEIVVLLRVPFSMMNLVMGLNACYFDVLNVRVGGKSQLLTTDPLGAQFFAEGAPLHTEEASADRPLVFFVKNTSPSARRFQAALVGQGRRLIRG